MTDPQAPSAPSELRLEGIDAAPGHSPVLHGVSLRVSGGHTTSVVGPSGSGKTTLLRVVAGLERATAGTVLIDGADVTDTPAHDRRIGVVFQEPRLFPHRSVLENVAFGLEVAGVPASDRRARAAAWLDRVGLAGLAERSVRGLSGGEQQRVNLARALACMPRLLLLDEPLSSVDPALRGELRALLDEVTSDVTCVHVTHDLGDAAELGDEVAVLLDGRIEQAGPAREVVQRPRTAAVATFLGSSVLSGVRRGEVVQLGDAGALRLDGASVDGDPDGAVQVAVRPESVTLAAAQDSDEPGIVHGRVQRAAYRGDHLAVEVLLADDQLLQARLPGTAAAEFGDRLRLRVRDAAVLHHGPEASTPTAPRSRP